MKILVPAEQALALSMMAARYMDEARAGSNFAAQIVRILTPLVKFRACRDAILAARAAMETRGGNGYIEEWVNSKIVRDAHIGVLWEGTSNINAIDVVRRAVGKARANEAMQAMLAEMVNESSALPQEYRDRLIKVLDEAFALLARVAGDPSSEHMARTATTGLYNAASAAALAWEAIQPGGEPRKLLISRFVLEHKLEPINPLAPPDGAWERGAYAALLDQESALALDDAIKLAIV